MCGRFALTAPASTIAEVFQVDVLPDVLPRYNIAPTNEVACVVREGDDNVMKTFRWGLIPSWAKDRKMAYKTINARAETVASKPAFRSAFKRRRILILADGFYEWERSDPKNKVPHLIQLREGKPFGMAGLWERWTDPETGEDVYSCTVVTTGPNDLMNGIHDRMPVILPEESWSTWLDPEVQDPARLSELLVPYPAEDMQERPVSRKVGDVKNKGEDVQGPWEG
ncbi:MAG: SOS response-associated peptidase [Alphaproteobacteria bacterium]|nr:SOS response-associated peptidase [Alphaproteobacteria bacterium]